MVTNITSLTGNGLKDWFIQRVTSVYMLVYFFVLLAYFFLHPHPNYYEWQALFHCPWFKGASLIASFAFLLHAWIGLWTVTTDYIKSTILRIVVQLLVVLWLLGQLIWGFMIMWGQ